MSANEFWRVIDNNFLKLVQLYESVDIDYESELFGKLLDKDYDINYRIPDSYIFGRDWLVGRTIFQLCAFQSRACQILIDHGANFTETDKDGSTYLLARTVNRDYKRYLESLKLYGSDKNCEAAVMLSAHISLGNSTNPKDANGLTHFHVACMYNHVDAAKFFLENGVPINETINSDSKFYPGYSALHFAVTSYAYETAELLLSLGADGFAQDSKGTSPLHILMADRKDILSRLKKLSKSTEAQRSQYSKIMLIYYAKNQRIINLILKKVDGLDCNLDNTGLSYFHVLCFAGNSSMIQQFLNQNKENLTQFINMDSPKWPGFRPVHFAANFSGEIVEILVKKGADLNAKDANGVSPFDICLREFTLAEVHRILLLQPDYSSIVFSDGKTKLSDFIQAMQETKTFESFLTDKLADPNMFIPFNSPICAGCTPLHLTIMCTEQSMSWSAKNLDGASCIFSDMKSDESQPYLSRIDSCLGYNPDVVTRDGMGLTPLHWAFRLQQSKVVHRLLKRLESSSNYVDDHGLSHLHIACAAGNEAVVQKLLYKGANVNGTVTLSYTWLDEDTADPMRLIDRFDRYFISKGSTPLHFATIAECSETVKILLDHNADVLAQDTDGLNPLERIFEVPIFKDSDCPKSPRLSSFHENEKEIIKQLVRKIGDRLVNTKPKQMLYCYSLLRVELFVEVLKYEDDSALKILETVGITALHVACFTKNLVQVNQLADAIGENFRVDLESPLWPGCTPLHLFTKSKNRLEVSPTNKAILKILLLHGADVAAMNLEGETPIHQSFPYSGWYFLGKMLKHLKNFSINPTNMRGFTHLHIAAAADMVAIVEKLLQQGAFVDQPTDYIIPDFGGFTALHLAAAYQRKNVVDVLLKHGANVNWTNARGGNVLHAANDEDRQPCLELLRTLIEAGADIHARNMFGQTPLETLIKSENRSKEEIELFLAHGSNVNTFNPVSNDGLLAVALNKSQQLPVFEIVVEAADVKVINDGGRNAIHNSIAFKRPHWVALEDEGDIDETYTPSRDYIRGIESLIKLGLTIDQQDNKSSTPLHLAARMQNLTGIIGLLENGADINIQDAYDKTALAYSLELAEECKELTELDRRILKVILTHLYKLNLARIGICASNRAVDTKIREFNVLDVTVVEACNDEVERMKEKQLTDSTSVTLYDFLSDTGAVNAFPYMLPCNREAISSFFKNEVESLREKYPEFTGILLLQYRKALARVDIIDQAVASLDMLAGFDVPAVCSRIIIRFLSNDELRDLTNATIP